MGQSLAKYVENGGGRRSDLPKRDGLKPEERKALWTMRREAKERGSLLTSGGKGGLPPSLVLGVMRRDKYRCKSCGRKGTKENGGIGIHHKGGIVESKWLSAKGHSNDPNNLVTICNSCHDEEHEKARADGVDSSQVTAKGDKGNPRRDHGKPVAQPGH
jgi:hypothetical protein